MHTFDASSMIHAWDNYPENQFPPLWDWMSELTKKGLITIPTIAYDEVKAKTPDCAKWLSQNGITKINIDNAIIQEAMRIKGLLGIRNDKFSPDGVGENSEF